MSVHKAHDITKEDINLVTLWIVEDDDLYRTAIADILNQTEGMRCEHALRSCEEMLKVMETEERSGLIPVAPMGGSVETT